MKKKMFTFDISTDADGNSAFLFIARGPLG